MKKLFILILIFMSITLTACKKNSEAPVYINFDNHLYNIAEDESTEDYYTYKAAKYDGMSTARVTRVNDKKYTLILDEEHYVIEGDKTNYKVTFPDQTSTTCTVSESTKTCQSDSYDYDRYDDYQNFLLFAPSKDHDKFNLQQVMIGIFAVIFGLAFISVPDRFWSISHSLGSWMYRDSEPSEAGLLYYQFIGFFLLVIGVIQLLVGIF